MEMESGTKKSPNRVEMVENIINELGDRINPKMFFVLTFMLLNSMVGCFCAYVVAFTGFMPESEWSCVDSSTKCNNLFQSYQKTGQAFYTIKTICDNKLEHQIDYVWHMDHSSNISSGNEWHLGRNTIAIDFNKVCDPDSLSFLKSVYFLGGVVGLCFGSMVFELLGRRKTALIGGFLCVLGTFVGAFCKSYALYSVIRVFQGFGNFLAYSGTYIWVMEFVPQKYRSYYNSWTMLIWAFGYPGLVTVSYFITTWQYIHVALAIIFSICFLPLAIFPDSPRYLMAVGREEEAKVVLEKYARLANNPTDFSSITLINSGASKSSAKKLNLIEQLKEFLHEKAMLLETLIQFWYWLVCCLLYYGLNYGWGAFGDSPYTNYLFAGLGEFIAYTLLLPITKYIGRRKGMLLSLTGACLCFLLGMINWQWTAVWNFERLTSIIAVIMISISFAMAYLYTGELSPTTHRGMVLASCSLCARIAGFLGPFMSIIIKDSRVKLAINSTMAGSAALLIFLLPDTHRIPIPEVSADVTYRRKRQNLGNIKSVISLQTHDSLYS